MEKFFKALSGRNERDLVSLFLKSCIGVYSDGRPFLLIRYCEAEDLLKLPGIYDRDAFAKAAMAADPDWGYYDQEPSSESEEFQGEVAEFLRLLGDESPWETLKAIMATAERVFTVTHVTDQTLVFYKDDTGYYCTRVYEPIQEGHTFTASKPAGDPVGRYVAVDWNSNPSTGVCYAYLIDLETGLVEDTLYQSDKGSWSKSGREWTMTDGDGYILGYTLAE